ncbi:MAG: PAS domain S-box protein [Phycisphaerales bacterium]|nr:PAS domain S-box protein [Phycisphaerae bacterium]NNM24762.1 PAS domain S-box protein [Phycisphaerales bacterium]
MNSTDLTAGATMAQLRAVLASTLDPVITIDARGRVHSASDSVERVFGWTPTELVGQNISILMPAPHQEQHDDYLADYRKTGTTNILGRTREFEGRRRDGSIFPLELSVSRVDVPGQAEPLFTGIIKDISDRKQGEEELRLLRTLSLAIGAAEDLESAMTVVLREICHATGWEYGEAWLPDQSGRRLRDTPVWHARDRTLEAFQAMTQGTTFGRGEGLPGRVWVSKVPEWLDDLSDDRVFRRAALASRAGLRAALAVPILSGDEVVAVIAFFMSGPETRHDRLTALVTAAAAPLGPLIERHRTQSALAESEGRLREMLTSVELVAVSIDAAGLITFCNDYLLYVTGFSRAEVLGRDWFELFLPAEGRERVREVLAVAIETGHIQPHFENEILTKSGERRLIAWNNTPLRNPGGDIVGATALGVDITQQRRDSLDIARHRDELERRVKERTAELEASHEALRQTDRLASIGTLVAGLGHDMSNVLLPIRCRLEALEASILPASAREHCAAVNESIAYLQQLTEGLRLLALDPDDADATEASTDVGQWWKQAEAVIRRATPGHCVFKSEISPGLPRVQVAAHRLSQAILNLVVNAGEANNEEGTIRFSADRTSDGQQVRLSVQDDGPGMPAEVRRQALDPFFTTKKRGLGTGLGLSLVHGVVKAAGGALSIETTPDSGTTVRLDFPIASGNEPVGPATTKLRAGISLEDPRIASLFRTMLTAAGFAVADGVSECDLLVVDGNGVGTPRLDKHLGSAGRAAIVCGDAPADERIISLTTPDDFELVRDAVANARRRLAQIEPTAKDLP